MICQTPLIVALDYDDIYQVETLVEQLDPTQCRLKVGKQLFTLHGPKIVEQLQKAGFQVFLDLKFHDIPNTVAKAVEAACSLGVWMVNIHASGGVAMMEAARNTVEKSSNEVLLTAVTVLTSIDESQFKQLNVAVSIQEQVLHLAQLAYQSGLHGVVCSAQESPSIKKATGSEFITVTPGIRPADSGNDDQQRICTPQQALDNGSDYLVVGRPITKSRQPREAIANIINTIT